MEEKSEHVGRNLALLFALVVLSYAGFYSCDHRMRTHKGPWQVRFVATNDTPRIVIAQATLGISNVTISFPGETVTNLQDGLVVFDRPEKPVPFGKVKFEDLTYLPGSVAFDFFGHEVELLPRTLYINKAEHAWISASNISLHASEKLPPDQLYDPRKKKKW